MKRVIAFVVLCGFATLVLSAQSSGLLLRGVGGPPPVAGGAANVPTDLSGLVFWISADCITYSPCGTPSDGSSVDNWADRSGNANNLTANAGGSRTFHTNVINSLPAVTIASATFALGSTISWGGAETIFVVFAETSTGAKGTFITGGASSFKYWTDNGGKLQGADSSQSAQIGTGSASADTSFHQINATYDSAGGAYAFRLASASDGSGTNAQSISSGQTTIAGDGGSELLQAKLAELFIYNRVLNGTEISQMETYLNTRYGL